MIDFENETDVDIDTDIGKKILDELCSGCSVEVVLTDSNSIQVLNKEYRGIDKPTDVLSFPLERVEGSPVGSIVINIDKVLEKSAQLNHSKDDEFTLLFLHGLLHLLGYDHESDNGEMRKREEEIIDKFSLPKSLIVRSE